MVETRDGLTQAQFVEGCDTETQRASDYGTMRIACGVRPRIVAVGIFSAGLALCATAFKGEARAKLRPILHMMIDGVWEGESDERH